MIGLDIGTMKEESGMTLVIFPLGDNKVATRMGNGCSYDVKVEL
jgi:hypothetical protein